MKSRRYRHSRAVTILELAVVIALASILAGISFLGLSSVQSSVKEESATLYATAVASAQLEYATLHGSFAVDRSDLVIRDSDVYLTRGVADRQTAVSMVAGSDGSVALSAFAEQGVCVNAVLQSPASAIAVTTVEGYTCDALPLLDASPMYPED